MRLLVTRPQPDADKQSEKLTSLGHDVSTTPLLEVEFLDPGPLPLTGAQALIATSRNALRAVAEGKDLKAALQLPIFVVGSATANSARELGFGDIHIGPGTAEEMLPLILSECEKENGALVHLAGERMAFDLKTALEGKGFEVAQPIIYRINMADSFAEAARKVIANNKLDGVILMSPATTQTFLAMIEAPELMAIARRLTYFCLSHKVAEPLKRLEDAQILIAGRPTEDDLLALIGHVAANW
jgi:uroporphyrinogen-III synthase